jgi:phosphoribosyl 1,2-cyclic phosphodiesterase
MGKGEGLAYVFLSHLHWDHVQGWPFFKPAYVPGNRFEIYARHEGVEERLRQQQTAPFFPPAAWEDMRASFTYHHMTEQPLELCDGRVKVSTIELNHPSCAYAFRFEADDRVFVYASDGAYWELDDASLQPFVEFYRDADLLVFDAHFTLSESFEKRTWGHSSAVVGVELACRANVDKLALFHHDPNADDELLNRMLRVAREYDAGSSPQLRRTPCEVETFLAYEGLSLSL